MKRKIFRRIIVMLLLVFAGVVVFKGQNTAAAYNGKWKVTRHLTTYYRAYSYFFRQHYLGRTVILGENSVEKSIVAWPDYLEWEKIQFDDSDIVSYSTQDEWLDIDSLWMIEDYADIEQVRFLRYIDEMYDGSDYCVDYIVILDKTHIVYGFCGGDYLLEPFQYCDPKVSEKDLNGTWKIAYLDSYENSYEGGFEEIEKEAPGRILQGTNFKAEDWLGKSVIVSEDEVRILETARQTVGIEVRKTGREDLEQEMDIHDGLSIYDDEILVCNIKCQDGEDIVCVPVNKNQMIMRIEEGWFMLEK